MSDLWRDAQLRTGSALGFCLYTALLTHALGDPPLPGSAVLLRGDLLDPDTLAESAQTNFEVYGFFGISVFAETPHVAWTDLANSRFSRLNGSCCSPSVTCSQRDSNCGTLAWRPTTTSCTPTWPSLCRVGWGQRTGLSPIRITRLEVSNEATDRSSSGSERGR